MMTKQQEHSTAWVCVDCYFMHNGITEHEQGHPYPAGTLSQLGDDVEVTAGLVAEEHDAYCPAFSDGEFTGEECSCERQEFSWSPCQGCGSTLGGSREALTVWFES